MLHIERQKQKNDYYRTQHLHDAFEAGRRDYREGFCKYWSLHCACEKCAREYEQGWSAEYEAYHK